jgi:hypothetical protein
MPFDDPLPQRQLLLRRRGHEQRWTVDALGDAVGEIGDQVEAVRRGAEHYQVGAA